MKLALVLALLAAPLSAQTRMDATACNDSYQAALAVPESYGWQLIIGSDKSGFGKLRNARPTVSVDGWCRLSAHQLNLPDSIKLAGVAWSVDGVEELQKEGGLPFAVALQLQGIRPDATQPPFDVTMSGRRTPGGSLLIIEEIKFADRNGTFLTATGVIDGAFFDTLSSAALSVGSLRLTQGLVEAKVTPALLRLFDVTERSPEAEAVIAGLKADQIGDSSRRDALAFLTDLPNAEGTLQVKFASDVGLGWLQVAMAGWDDTRSPDEAAAFMMTGSQLTVDWQPR